MNIKDEKILMSEAAAEYITSIIRQVIQKIALSWGRTVQELINILPEINTNGNIIFPLFGATDNEHFYFPSN